jgi:hypothetical protein
MDAFSHGMLNSILKRLHPYTLAGVAVLSIGLKGAIENMWESGEKYTGCCKYHFRNKFYRVVNGRVIKVLLNPPTEALNCGIRFGCGQCKHLHVSYESGTQLIMYNKIRNTYIESEDIL